MKPLTCLLIYNTRKYTFYAIRHLVLPVLIVSMVASACTSEISEEEMAAKTVNIQGRYSEKELSTIKEVAEAELSKYR